MVVFKFLGGRESCILMSPHLAKVSRSHPERGIQLTMRFTQLCFNYHCKVQINSTPPSRPPFGIKVSYPPTSSPPYLPLAHRQRSDSPAADSRPHASSDVPPRCPVGAYSLGLADSPHRMALVLAANSSYQTVGVMAQEAVGGLPSTHRTYVRVDRTCCCCPLVLSCWARCPGTGNRNSSSSAGMEEAPPARRRYWCLRRGSLRRHSRCLRCECGCGWGQGVAVATNVGRMGRR